MIIQELSYNNYYNMLRKMSSFRDLRKQIQDERIRKLELKKEEENKNKMQDLSRNFDYFSRTLIYGIYEGQTSFNYDLSFHRMYYAKILNDEDIYDYFITNIDKMLGDCFKCDFEKPVSGKTVINTRLINIEGNCAEFRNRLNNYRETMEEQKRKLKVYYETQTQEQAELLFNRCIHSTKNTIDLFPGIFRSEIEPVRNFNASEYDYFIRFLHEKSDNQMKCRIIKTEGKKPYIRCVFDD